MRKVLLFVLVVVMCRAAGDASGTWSGTFKPDAEDRTLPLVLILHQDGEMLTGSGGPTEAEQHPLKNGKVAAGRMTFEVPAGPGVFSFDLKIAGDDITGDLSFKNATESRTAKVTLKRLKG